MRTPGHPHSAPPWPEVLTVDEVAKLLRVNRKTVYEAVQRDEIPGAFHIGRVIRFSRDQLLTWAGQGRVVPDHEGQQ